jgi:NAD(P)-dependent dehydrogenase (short-subunit alcohol dehydrogenase family)
MVSLKVVKATNAQLKSAPSGLTFFFAGATNGIGLAALTALARHGNAPVAYIVGRSQTKFQPHLDSLKKLNPEGKFIFIEAQITELKEVKRVCDRVKSEVGRLDVLCLSPGYLTLVNHREGMHHMHGLLHQHSVH